MRNLYCAALVLWGGLGSLQAADCAATHEVASGDTIRGLAQFYFGDAGYWPSIVLATNSREGFAYIGNLNDVGRIPKVCIPQPAEAERWRLLYQRYLGAVADMALPEPWEVARDLVILPADAAVPVVTWIRSDLIGSFRDGAGWRTKAPNELWVTVEPHLQEFCRAFAAVHGGDAAQLTLRLEQRLGLPPVSNKTVFLRMRVSRPSQDVIFRPCMDPATTKANCPVGEPPDTAGEAHQRWFYRNYYESYGKARLSSFPWTTLGYTFDWAAAPDGRFERFGESEFVIPKGASIEIEGPPVGTADYCKPN